ncbi:MAG TPA: DinB family protein [Candidatus Dormibacteraeota bacterium]|nr:DinB family protein [Candidatus Dormibacteraeota bacterium]
MPEKKAKKIVKRNQANEERELRRQLTNLLKGGGAHVQFDDALDGLPANKRGAFAPGLPHTAWQLVEHMRLAQWDVLEFTRNPKHVSPEFPEGYWPPTPSPKNNNEWDRAVRDFKKNLREMIRLVQDPRSNLFLPIKHGQGQSILREALILADHNSYHLGQLVCLRRALRTWPEG